MRNRILSLLVASAAFAASGAARAQQPVYPYPVEDSGVVPAQAAAPQAPPVVVQPAPQAQQPQPVPQVPQVQVQVQTSGPPTTAQPTTPPPAYYPPPPPGGSHAPPGYYYPPPGWAAPLYSYPPPAYPYPYPYPYPRTNVNPPPRRPGGCVGGRCPYVARKPPAPAERARYFSLGGRATFATFNQSIGDKNVDLAGGGAEMRFRSRGRFGLEASIDWLHGAFHLNGPIARDSVPVAISAMFYIFPNSDAHHFNLYLLGGGGVVPTTMTLVDPANDTVKQKFTEYEAHLGVGIELRFKWFALRADGRGMSLWRDNGADAGAFYAGVPGAPVPEKSKALVGTVGGAFWF